MKYQPKEIIFEFLFDRKSNEFEHHFIKLLKNLQKHISIDKDFGHHDEVFVLEGVSIPAAYEGIIQYDHVKNISDKKNIHIGITVNWTKKDAFEKTLKSFCERRNVVLS